MAEVSSPDAAPRYQTVKDYIRRHIVAGDWLAGDTIPSEHKLTKQFGVSRMTVNRALRELSAEGLVTRVQGVGTFVAEPRPQLSLLEIRNIADEIAERGHTHHAVIHDLRRVAAHGQVARNMGCPDGSPVFHSLLVHHDNNVPVQLEDRYVNPKLVPDYLKADFAHVTPSEYLLARLPVSEMEHDIEAVLPEAQTARLLRMPADEPCLRVRRRSWSNGTVVTLAELTHPGTRYRVGGRVRAN